MYRIYANGQTLHNPFLADDGRIVIDPVLREKLNTHGSLEFGIAPTNPLYSQIEPRKTLIKVMSDSENSKPWFGRVMSMERGWKNVLTVYCEGEFGCLCDSIDRPYGFKGVPSALLQKLIATYNGSQTHGYEISMGHVTVTDPNNLIVRSSNEPMPIWNRIEDALFGSSLGGYVLPRYDAENDVHYIDYLSLDENDPYAKTSTQKIEFGRNLLDFAQTWNAADVMTVLVPYGALRDMDDPDYEEGPPENGAWDGNRIHIASVNNGRRWIENQDGIDAYGRIVGTHTWDDVTQPSNLLTKATAWLAQQIWQSVTLEISAVDLSFVNVDIDQIQVGEYVRCESKAHDMNVLLLCTEKETRLTQLESSAIILGAGLMTITDLQKRGQTNGNNS